LPDYTVVMMEHVTALAMRMRKLLEGSRICVYDADGKYKLYATLGEAGGHVTLLLLDLDIEQGLAMGLLQECRQKLPNTPIVVITQGRSRSFFVEAMLHGATDFVIKPFMDDVFLSKIFKYVVPECQDTGIVTCDIGRYLKGELRKAEKGSFPVSVMLLSFTDGDGILQENRENGTGSAFIFEHVKELFWETDIIIHFAAKYYLGIFPFCDEKNTRIIERKIRQEFEKLRAAHSMLANYVMTSVFVSYPFDTGDISEVYEVLLSRVHDELEEEINVRLTL
jgi:two-component system, OmpR family, response regulator PhoP